MSPRCSTHRRWQRARRTRLCPTYQLLPGFLCPVSYRPVALGAGLPCGFPKTTHIMRGNTVQLIESLEFQTAATGHPFLTSALHVSPGSPQLFPANLWTPPEMSPFGGWGMLAAFLALLCCRGEPGGPDWVCASQRVCHLYPWYHAEKGVLVLKLLGL